MPFDPENKGFEDNDCQDGCRMLSCSCLEEGEEWKNQIVCLQCHRLVRGVQFYRCPRIHGGWSGFFCGWNCVKTNNLANGGNVEGREMLIDHFSMLEREAAEVEDHPVRMIVSHYQQ